MIVRPLKRFAVVNIGELVTNQNYIDSKLNGNQQALSMADLSAISNAWLMVSDGRIENYGAGDLPQDYQNELKIDAQGGLILPGLIDCHTHAIFAGDRSDEFARRLNGESYEQIAAQGGGIQSTIKATRAASDEQLFDLTLNRLNQFLEHGVTTVEVKTGYGQNPEQEIRLLNILNRVAAHSPQHIEKTCLALHALPAGEYENTKQFVDDMIHNLLPTVAEKNLAQWVDGFIENAYFSAEQAAPFFEAAEHIGLKARIHADEFEDSQAAKAAAHWKCASADHLQKANLDGLMAMAQQGTKAVLLPGTSLYTGIAFTSANLIRSAGCRIAIATDFNPGSCYLHNLAFIASLASLHNGLSLPETILGVTACAAEALELGYKKGALARGYDADFSVYPLQNKESWIADFGQTKPRDVFVSGVRVNRNKNS